MSAAAASIPERLPAYERWLAGLFTAASSPPPVVWLSRGVNRAEELRFSADTFRHLPRLFRDRETRDVRAALLLLLSAEGCGDRWWDRALPFPARADCVRSMGVACEHLGRLPGLADVLFNWWDYVLGGLQTAGDDIDRADELLRAICLETLGAMLDRPPLWESALHGLGHLHSEASRQRIDGWLGEHPQIEPRLLEYALECRHGLML